MSTLEQFPEQLTGSLTHPPLVSVMVASASAGAVGGMATGLGVALYRGITLARRPGSPERSELVTDGLTEVGAGALIGAVAATAAAFTGAGLAALLGRSILSVALPGVLGALAAAAIREPAVRASNRMAKGVVPPGRRLSAVPVQK
jgi:hypothetical protein